MTQRVPNLKVQHCQQHHVLGQGHEYRLGDIIWQQIFLLLNFLYRSRTLLLYGDSGDYIEFLRSNTLLAYCLEQLLMLDCLALVNRGIVHCLLLSSMLDLQMDLGFFLFCQTKFWNILCLTYLEMDLIKSDSSILTDSRLNRLISLSTTLSNYSASLLELKSLSNFLMSSRYQSEGPVFLIDVVIADSRFKETTAVLKHGWMWGRTIWFFASLLFLSLLFMLCYIYSVIHMNRTSLGDKKRGSQLPSTDQVFQIRLRNTGEKIDLTDPGFLRMLELEYATKYLQHIKIQPTAKNIQNIIKRNPLSKCTIQESRLTGGLHTDTITIFHRNQQEKQAQVSEEAGSSEQIIKSIGLKKLRTDVFKREQIEVKQRQRTVVESELEEMSTKVEQVRFDFNIQKMKGKYIFPFNQSFSRRNNSLLRDKSEYNTEEPGEKLIFESKIFSFPFTEVKVPTAALKELQTPINLTGADIQNRLDIFCSQFPRVIFPVTQNSKKGDQELPKIEKKHTYHPAIFQPQEVQKLFTLIRSDQMARLVGVFMHFSYWMVFGNVNPINVDSGLKKQMYLAMFQTIEYFNMNNQNKKVWLTLYMPMILLTIKMISDYLFREVYPIFFVENTFQPSLIGNIATDKIIFLVQNIFDPSNLNGRFIFLQSVFNDKQSLNNDRKNIRKRIYGTSPMLNMILSHPKDGKTRSILAKKYEIECRQKIFESQTGLRSKSQPMDILSKLNAATKKQNQTVSQGCQQKMLNVVLSKLQSRIEAKLGPNRIIKLGTNTSALR